MSADGNTVAICTNESVLVYTYNPISRNWVQIGTDTDIIFSSDYGSNIDMSADGKMFVIGIPTHDNKYGETYSGIVQVYAFDSIAGNWFQVGSNIDGEMELELFGSSVAMSADGKTIAASKDYDQYRSGNVHVFAYNSIANAWLQVGNIIKGEEGHILSITSVDMSANGKIIAIGVVYDYNSDPNFRVPGFVRVYRISSATKQWTPIGSDIIGEAEGDWFGYSISMSANGKNIAISAPFNAGNGIDSGHVRVYSFNDRLSRWVQVGNDIDGEAPNDMSGRSVAISDDGKTIAVGASSNDNPNGEDSGHVRVYSYVSSTKIWTQIGRDINGITASDGSGESLALSADGSTIIIGAPYGDSVSDDNDFGYVRVYKYKHPQGCTPSWRLYNLQNNTIVDLLVNGTRIRNPPPCGFANIEAFVPCANTTSHVVTTELYDNQGKLYKSRTDTKLPYFLYDKYGKIKAGTYTIRAIVNSTVRPITSVVSPYTKFTLLGQCA
jgi:FG-GAP repeat